MEFLLRIAIGVALLYIIGMLSIMLIRVVMRGDGSRYSDRALRAARKRRGGEVEEDPAQERAASARHAPVQSAPMTRRMPGEAVSGRSRIGGAPDLPAAMVWPVDHETARPLHFLARIDCAEIPVRGHLAPRDGMLYFFADLAAPAPPLAAAPDADAGTPAAAEPRAPAIRVLHAPVAPAEDAPDPLLPKGLPEILHDGSGLARAGGALRRSLPPWRFTFTAPLAAPAENGRNPLFPPEGFDPDALGRPAPWIAAGAQETLLAVEGAVEDAFRASRAALSAAETRLARAEAERDIQDPDDAPYAAARAAEALRRAARARAAAAAAMDGVEAALAPLAARARAAREAACAGSGTGAPLAPDAAAEIVDILTEAHARFAGGHPLGDPVRRGLRRLIARAALAPPLAHAIPEDCFAAFSAELAPRGGHLALGRAEDGAARLLRLAADPVAELSFGGAAALEFRIAPDALAERRFEEAYAVFCD